MSQMNVDSIYDKAGSGEVDFPNGLSKNSLSIVGGTYSPVLTSITNMTGIIQPTATTYLSLGNVCVVSGYCQFQNSGGGIVRGKITLPVSTTFVLQGDCAGAINAPRSVAAGTDAMCGSVYAHVSSGGFTQAEFSVPQIGATALGWSFMFLYQIK